MRTFIVQLVIVMFCLPLMAQSPRTSRGGVSRVVPRNMLAGSAESAIRQAMDMLVAEKKMFDRDLEVLRDLHGAEDALVDPTQPNNAIQKSYEQVDAAKALNPDFLVMQGVITSQRALEQARLSPASTDFGRLRGIIRSEALAPAARLVARNGARLQDETLAWIKIQELISSHLRSLAEISAESLRAAQQ
jgi:hypothetical protein